MDGVYGRIVRLVSPRPTRRKHLREERLFGGRRGSGCVRSYDTATQVACGPVTPPRLAWRGREDERLRTRPAATQPRLLHAAKELVYDSQTVPRVQLSSPH
jgi:hypothetical protein